MPASHNQSKPLSQMCNWHGPLLRLRARLGAHIFFKRALHLNFNRIVEHVLLIMGVQQLKDTSSIIFAHLALYIGVCAQST